MIGGSGGTLLRLVFSLWIKVEQSMVRLLALVTLV